MNLWRLEWLRLIRTRRWIALAGVFVAFGLIGPVSARYLPDLVAHAGGGVKIIVPPPVPADGIRQFTGNATQIGVVVVVVVAVAAFAFDTRPGLAIFYRTHVRRARDLILPRYVVVSAAAIVTFVLGTLAAVYETVVLLGGLPAARVTLGVVLESLFLLLCVAVAAAATTVTRSSLAAIGLSLAILLAMPLVGSIGPAGSWVPSKLTASLDTLVAGTSPSTYTKATLTCLAAIAVFLSAALVRVGRREL